MSSGAQAMGRLDFEDLQGEHGYSGQRAYNASKLANVMFAFELARRLEGSPDLDSVTGAYYANRTPKQANKFAYDLTITARLWDVSAELVHPSNHDSEAR